MVVFAIGQNKNNMKRGKFKSRRSYGKSRRKSQVRKYYTVSRGGIRL